MSDLVWLDGQVRPAAEARVALLDRGLQQGEALFETVRAYRGVPFRLEAHFDRMAAGAAAIGIAPPPREAFRVGIAALLAACGLRDARVRLVLTAGLPGGTPSASATAEPAPPPPRPAVLVLAPPRAAVPLADVKLVGSIASRLARDAAVATGADDALFVTPDGRLLEGTRSNVFVVAGDRLCTPPTDGTILRGVTRDVVREVAAAAGIPCLEGPVPVSTLGSAREVFCTGSVAELWPVAEVRGHFRGAAPGPLTMRLAAAYAARVAAECGT